MEKLKLGIIGYGNMGTSHARNIAEGKVPNVELMAICDIDPARKEACTKNHPQVAFFDNHEDLMKSGLCDAVLIAVPHYDHPPMAIKAFELGLNVITEKPAGVYTKQVLEMNEAAAKSNKVFGIMYNQRTDRVYQRLKQMIDNGELGHIKRITWIVTSWYRCQAYHNSSAWRSRWETEGGGTLINQNPHQLDLWQWLFGVPDKVFAKVGFGKYYDIEVEDEVVAFFDYNNGTIGQYITSTAEAPGTNRLEIACDMGRIIVEGNTITFHRNNISEREWNKISKAPFGRPKTDVVTEVIADGGEQHPTLLKNYADAVLTGSPLLAPGEEGIKGLTISNAIHLSGWTGETIDLNNFPHQRFYDILQEKIKNSTYKKTVNKVHGDTRGTY